VFMRIWNADGGEVGACGNAARCVASLVAAERGEPHVSIETESGTLDAAVNRDGSVTIDMGAPRFAWNEIPLSQPFDDTRRIALEADHPALNSPSVINVGNPHCLFFVDDVAAHDLARLGPVLEHHKLFPERANISLVQVLAPDAIKVRTWERGAGLTRACGTAACAAAVAAAQRELTGRKVKVSLPGGDLLIEWRESDGHILMTGPYALDYESTLPAELFQPASV
jgi:diaminopimelate epimerase